MVGRNPTLSLQDIHSNSLFSGRLFISKMKRLDLRNEIKWLHGIQCNRCKRKSKVAGFQGRGTRGGVHLE
jgi:hypothetical protein